MSGRNRGRKSSRAKGRGRGRARARPRAAPGAPAADNAAAAAREPDSPERDAAEDAAEPGPAADAAAAAAAPLPLDCGLALRARRAAGSLGPAAARAPSPTERLAADPVFVGTAGLAGRPRPGPRGGGRRGGAAAAGGKKAGGKGKRGALPGARARAPAEPPPDAPDDDAAASAPGPAPDGCVPSLEAVQLRLEGMNAQADRAYLRLARKFGQLRLRHLERRDLLIRAIPGFWGRALLNHPRLRPFLSARDRRVLAHLRRLEVEELGLARLGYRIKLHFGRNPFFRNQVLVKEYGCGPAGHVVSRSTPIHWLPGEGHGHDHGQDQGQGDHDHGRGQSQGDVPGDIDGHGDRDRDHDAPSFFSWFSNHGGIESDKIVEIINEELWPNPLQFYLMSEEAPAENEKENENGQEGQQEPEQEPEPEPEPEPDGEGEPEPEPGPEPEQAEAPGLATPDPAN